MNPAEFANIAQAERGFWWYRGMRRILTSLLDEFFLPLRNRRVLEAGCGTGYTARFLTKRYGCSIFGLDLGWEGLQFCRASRMTRLVQGNLNALPYADAAFDAVISLDVLVHFPRNEDREAVRELVRVIAPGGLLILRVAALDSLRSQHSVFIGERQRYTASRLVALLKEQGVTVERCTYANSLLLPVAWTKFRILEGLLRRPSDSGVKPVPRWLNRLLVRPLLLESRWLRAGRNLPLGQSLVVIARRSLP